MPVATRSRSFWSTRVTTTRRNSRSRPGRTTRVFATSPRKRTVRAPRSTKGCTRRAAPFSCALTTMSSFPRIGRPTWRESSNPSRRRAFSIAASRRCRTTRVPATFPRTTPRRRASSPPSPSSDTARASAPRWDSGGISSSSSEGSTISSDPAGVFRRPTISILSIRALLTGWHVYETTELSVVHDGFRTFAQGKEHARRDWVALGACFAKPLRARRLSAAIIPLWFFPRRALFPPLFDLLRLRRPRGIGRILAFVEGFADGLKTAVDPATLRFKAPSGSRP